MVNMPRRLGRNFGPDAHVEGGELLMNVNNLSRQKLFYFSNRFRFDGTAQQNLSMRLMRGFLPGFMEVGSQLESEGVAS